MRQLLLDLDRAPAPTFANFVPGGNAELLHALRAAVGGASPAPVLYMWGEAAAGKTHLALATEAEGGRAVRVIDDVDRLDEAQQAALFADFVDRGFACLVVTARAAPADLAMRRDLATRLASGLTFRLLPLTDAEKRAALAAHAASRGFALGDEVLSYLLTHAPRDMGSLMAALDAIDRHSLETGRPVTVPLLKAALAA